MTTRSRDDLAAPRAIEVADGVFAYVQPDGGWWINSTGFIRGTNSVVSVDTCSTQRRSLAYLDTVRELTGGTPRVLINTHHHGDHTNGNCLVPGATIVGHRQCREEILATGIAHCDGLFEPVDWGELRPTPPVVTFEHRLNLFVDDLEVQLIHLSDAAHTTNDVVAWIPERGVLFSGDLVFNGGTPFVVMGSLAGSLEALSLIEDLAPTVIIPGHGEPTDLETVRDCARYLRWVADGAVRGTAAGLTPLDAAREMGYGEFAELGESERLAGNLHRAFAEVHGATPGDPIDLVAAFTDMNTLDGRRPLRCRA